MKKIVTEWIEILIGLVIFSFGIHFTIQANIGLAPWDCLGIGISKHTPLNYGLAMTFMSVIILIIDLFLKENIGFGTVFDAFCTGNFINFFIEHSPFHPTNLVSSIVMILVGIVIASIGQFFYMRASQGCGPRDTLLVGLGKRLHKISIGTVNIMILSCVLIIGVLLGGSAGIGTIIATFGTGVIMDLVFKGLHFEPRNIKHKNLLESIEVLKDHV